MSLRWSWYGRMNRSGSDSLHKLLGELEIEIMEEMWLRSEATVRDVATVIQEKRPVAYTTVMTVMGHLTHKGLLSRIPLDKRTHLYRVALTREEFLARSSQKIVDALLEDFGDMALAQFIEAVEQVDIRHLDQLRQRSQDLKAETGP